MKFHEMTYPEQQKIDRDQTVVIAPIAACEQHSHHLATYTDTVLVTGVAEGVESQLANQVLLLPTMWMGASQHHLRFGATLTLTVENHIEMLKDLLTPLLESGFRRIMILNGHGGNVDTLHVALRSLQPKYPDRHLTGASYWELASDELAELAEGSRKGMGHACEFETSMMLALRPDLVRTDQLKDDPAPEQDPRLRGLFTAEDMMQKTDHGAVGYPELASAEKGKRFLEAAIRRTVEVVQGLLKSELPK